jgi:hypothetical protein
MHGLIPIAFFLAVLFPTMLVAIALLKWRRHRLRKIRKSPLTSDLLRPPAQRLREQLDEVRDELDLYVTMLVSFQLCYSQCTSRNPISAGPLRQQFASA